MPPRAAARLRPAPTCLISQDPGSKKPARSNLPGLSFLCLDSCPLYSRLDQRLFRFAVGEVSAKADAATRSVDGKFCCPRAFTRYIEIQNTVSDLISADRFLKFQFSGAGSSEEQRQYVLQQKQDQKPAANHQVKIPHFPLPQDHDRCNDQ